MGKRVYGLENNIGWVTLSVKAAAVVYGAYRLQVWWLKSIREELGED